MKFCVEEITMGFAYPRPVSKFFGYFNSPEEAVEWCEKHYPGYKKIEEGEIPFFQKDKGVSVVELYVQNCEDEGFIRYSTFSEAAMTRVDGQ